MGTRALGAKQQKAHVLNHKQRDWLAIRGFLRDAEYQQASARFYKILESLDQTDDFALSPILTAAHQLCLACRQYRDEIERYQQGYAEAVTREREMRQQLGVILAQVEKHLDSAATEDSEWDKLDEKHSRMGNGRTLWQRVRSLWVREPSSQPLPDVPDIESSTLADDHLMGETAVVSITPESHNLAPLMKKDTPHLTIYSLGTFRVYLNDRLISEWNGLKGQSIFKYLITHSQKPINKDILLEEFWPETDIESARNNLNVAIYNLRNAFRSIHPDFFHLLLENGSYLFNPSMEVWVDFEEFMQHYEGGRILEKQGRTLEAIKKYEIAESLYEGDLFPGNLYEDWIIPHREGLKDIYLIILERLSQFYLNNKQYAACIHFCQKILGKDDCREDAHRRLMRCYSYQGQRNLALRQYHLCVESLEGVLDVTPMPETTALYRKIRNGVRVQEVA